MTLSNGKLRVPQDGRYYLYSQVITMTLHWSHDLPRPDWTTPVETNQTSTDQNRTDQTEPDQSGLNPCPICSSRCISVIRLQQPMMETSAASATSWSSVSTRKPPTPVQSRYLIFCVLLTFLWSSSSSHFHVLLCLLQLLKGVGTKCWSPDAEYALHSIYQGGLFELRAGDELFVSVSSPTMVNSDDSSSYFGAFRLDL